MYVTGLCVLYNGVAYIKHSDVVKYLLIFAE